MRLFTALFFAFLVSGCCSVKKSPECAKNRIQKIMQHHPDIDSTFRTVEHDTLVDHDTIISEMVFLDTVFNLNVDTVFVMKQGKVETEIRVVKRDVIKVKTQIESDTIIVSDTIIREKIHEVQIVDTSNDKYHFTRSKVWFYLVTSFSLFILLLVLFLYLTKRFKIR